MTALICLKIHLLRSGSQASIILENIDSRQLISDLKWSVPAAWLHDLARLISQGSDHDDWGDRLFEENDIKKEIIGAKHQPIPIEGDVDDFDPRTFDTHLQSIVRLADVGGKVDLETGLLRESVDELRKFSKKVQLSYLEKRDLMWAEMDDPEQAIENYTRKEAKALTAAIEYLESIGVDWWDIVKKINQGQTEELSVLTEFAK